MMKLSGLISERRRKPRRLDEINIEDRDVGYVTNGVFSPHMIRALGLGYGDRAFSKTENDFLND